ncbi:hypothetical protein JAAARDRAFT_40360 [Jaapia argillacea MUCL 33604]|uniref:Cytochrome P450 n=1 Tax=Jaapia argillacea MUCL 33604 TaxID=933084 RepID=A0A067PEG9_9AGAM|nr:hypothetical protein JAAARDRAFT_40360 [Jaapia argillacea MUCL 33604]
MAGNPPILGSEPGVVPRDKVYTLLLRMPLIDSNGDEITRSLQLNQECNPILTSLDPLSPPIDPLDVLVMTSFSDFLFLSDASPLLRPSFLFFIFSGILVGYLFVGWFRSRKKHSLCPPGPSGVPILGNIFHMPTEASWITFSRWGEIWGDIISVRVLQQPIIILNSASIATEMLNKKSAIYSDRPTMMMGGELAGWKNMLALTRYNTHGDRFRKYRRYIHRVLGTPASIEKYYHVEEEETLRFLRRVVRDPDDVQQHIRKSIGAVVLKISHGYNVQDSNDPFVDIADRANAQLSCSLAPGAYLVDLFPILRHVPEWFPFANFKRTAASWANTLNDVIDLPFDFVKREMFAGTAVHSFTSDLLQEDLDFNEENIVKWAAASLYSGGADTSVSTIHSFFLAMVLYPEVQKKAQAEIDRVVGNDRLPTYSDRENLPYVEAIISEVLRWKPVAPLGLPHRVMKDDVHAGYHIPKDSIIIANIWQFLHDPRSYHDPEEFNPERFLPTGTRAPEPDPRTVCFGFGRRTCPGIHLAEASVYLFCARALATLNISKIVENGVVVEPVCESTSGFLSHPKPFRCNITPRSPKALGLVEVAL